MQIHSLTFQGIGPYPGEHTIDFARLGESGLFLLEGPTGAGKSTIIDAIVFGIYGDVAGEGSSKARLVSTHLKPGDTPFVDLVVETPKGIYRVHRTPDFQRPKKRGTGFTTAAATISLSRLADPTDTVGVPISSHKQDANIELREAVGLTREQFTQTVVLPQGQFATFLRSGPGERRQVLEDIFGTQLYTAVKAWLRERARTYQNQITRTKDAVRAETEHFITTAWSQADLDADLPTAASVRDAAATPDPITLQAGMAARLEELGAEVATAKDAEQKAAAAAEETRTAWEDAKDVDQRLTQLRQWRAERAKLAELDDAMAEKSERLERGRRAQQVARAVDASRRADTAAAAALTDAQRAVETIAAGPDGDLIETCGPAQAWSSATVAAAHDARDVAQQERASLEALATLEAGLERRAAALQADSEKSAADAVGIEAAMTELAGRSEHRAAVVEELARARTGAEALGDAQAAVTEAKERHRAAELAAKLAVELEERRQSEATLTAERDHALAQYTDGRNRWLAGLAGTLAGELVEGQPCAVCGSVSHPAPATRDEDHVDADAVERLESARNAAEQALTQAQAATLGTIERYHEAAQATGGLDLETAAAQLDAALATQSQAQQAAAEATRLTTQLEQFDAASRTLEHDPAAAERQWSAAAAAHAERTTALGHDQKAVETGRAGFASVAERRSRPAERAEHAAELAAVAEALLDACEQQRTRAEEQAAALTDSGFESPEQVDTARLDVAVLATLASEVKAHQEATAKVTSLLAQEHIACLTGDEVVDVEAAQAAHAQATAVRDAALRTTQVAASRLDNASACQASVVRELTALQSAGAQAGPIVRMAELASGGEGNEHRIDLPTFVLRRRFDEVIELANLRLSLMTGGRYELLRTDEREGREQSLGLGLAVVDHASDDAQRAPSTLSGGETFLASLALLGMADAVTAEAGGIKLDTLFIDEGFGTLDQETLDLVMAELGKLRSGGRSVGIVSHVTELKQRIAEQINITRRRDGSSTLRTTIDG